jgi:hypothetical protein
MKMRLKFLMSFLVISSFFIIQYYLSVCHHLKYVKSLSLKKKSSGGTKSVWLGGSILWVSENKRTKIVIKPKIYRVMQTCAFSIFQFYFIKGSYFLCQLI